MTIIKKTLKVLSCFILLFICACNSKTEKWPTLYVYNWGIYIDESVISKFEKKYNCKVVYDTYDTNNEMYIVEKTEARIYDVLCPSDYMIEKMKNESLLYKYDIKNLKNYSQIDKRILDIMKGFDSDNTYAVPYVYSTIGLLYNKTLIDKKNLPYPKHWEDLWDLRYSGDIVMQDEMRDLLLVGLKKNGYSINTKDMDELNKATEDLIKQKPLVDSYFTDQAREKMVSGETAISTMYSGEVEYIKGEGKNFEYEYVIPDEGTVYVIDAWVIPKNAKNKNLAIKWIDYMLEPEIALLNYDFMHYGIPNLGAIEKIKERDGEDVLKKEYIFPDISDMKKYEIYRDLGSFEEAYNDSYKQIKS